jgi:hypothetical protein
MLEYHYKNNLELRTMIDNLESFSLEDIDNSTLPKWMRLALKQKKEIQIANQQMIFNIQEGNIKENYVQDVSGKILKWNGTETYIYFGRSQILVNLNDLIFVSSKGIWLDTVFSKTIDPKLNQCVFVKNATFSEYKTFRQNELQKKYPNFDKLLPVIGQSDNISNTQPFSIYRP